MISVLCLFVAAQAATVAIDADKNRPVTKVIDLLKDMQSQLAKEAEEDEEVFQKVKCWCTVNDKDKTKAISDQEGRITDLTSKIEEESGSSARLTTEIKNLENELAKNNKALDSAIALRKSELAEFVAEEKDLLLSIGALKSAVQVLGKQNSFIQTSDTALNMAAALQGVFHKHADMVDQIATPSQKSAVRAFIQAPADYFDEDSNTAGQSYASASGPIFGILKQMKETFETNLANSQKEEKEGQSSFASLKKAKEAEIAAAEEQRDTKTQELADSGAAHAQATQDLEDTRNSLAADQEFLANLKMTCQNTDQQFEERTKIRQEEIQACGEALAILSSDDAHDTFTKTFNFVQVQTEDRRVEVATLLNSAAKKFSNPRLATLSVAAKLDTFAKLTEDIDQMIAGLLQEQKDDTKQRDYCKEAFHQNEMAMEQKARDMEQSDAKIAALKESIAQLTQNIEDITAEIAEMQKQLKRAGEDREAENTDFQTVIKDQRATQELLTNALNVLKGFYEKSFLQKADPAGPPAPAGFKTYKKSGGSGGVMGMLEGIIAEAKQLEADAITGEEDSQKAYAAFVQDTQKSIKEKERDLTNKKDSKAKAEADLVSAVEERDSQAGDQQRNENENADLHNSCDFLLNNFETRQTALEAEQESLRQAKAILSGSQMSMFLQKRN